MGGLRQEVGQTVSSVKVSGSGASTAFATAAKLKAVYIVNAGTAGGLVLRDGGAGGAVLLDIDTPAAVGSTYVELPDGGIDFATDIHATLTTIASVTLIYR